MEELKDGLEAEQRSTVTTTHTYMYVYLIDKNNSMPLYRCKPTPLKSCRKMSGKSLETKGIITPVMHAYSTLLTGDQSYK